MANDGADLKTELAVNDGESSTPLGRMSDKVEVFDLILLSKTSGLDRVRIETEDKLESGFAVVERLLAIDERLKEIVEVETTVF